MSKATLAFVFALSCAAGAAEPEIQLVVSDTSNGVTDLWVGTFRTLEICTVVRDFMAAKSAGATYSFRCVVR